MGVVIVEGEGAVLGVNVGHSIVTNGILCVRGGDAAPPKLLRDFLLKSEKQNVWTLFGTRLGINQTAACYLVLTNLMSVS